MNRSAGNATGGGLRAFWLGRTPRERRVLGWGGTLLFLVLLGLSGIEPALDGRERWRKDLPQLRADAAQVEAMSQQLSAAPPPATGASSSAPPVDKASLEAGLATQGLKAQSLTVQDAGGTLLVRVNLDDVPFSALTEWLQQLQRTSQLSVSDASVSVRDKPDRVDARLTLRRPS